MRNAKKININILDIFPNVQTNTKCDSCPHCDSCPLHKAFDRKPDPSYERSTRDFLNQTEEVKIPVFSCPCCDEEKISTTKGLFGYKRWFPTYLILLCVALVLDYEISPAKIVDEIFAHCETKIPSASTIYRWAIEYKEYMNNPEKSKHADVFNPIETLGKLCRNAVTAVKSHSIFDLFNNYIEALQRVFDIKTRPYTIIIPS